MKLEVSFPSASVDYLIDSKFSELNSLDKGRSIILLTDDNIYKLYPNFFQPNKTIVVSAGEENKSWQTVQLVAEQMIAQEVDKNCLLVGIGGGMITDLTGFIASVYMRGVQFGFVPTTLLAMVDAAIGGKNGVNLGLYKNMLGTIHQPEFILYDSNFITTLPAKEWSNGFAEIIKYACIVDVDLWNQLSRNNIATYQNNEAELLALIQTCVNWKNKTVQEDEHEKGIRKLLNFGHTTGHAIEKSLNLPHGFAVGIGMIVACLVSEKTCGLNVVVRKQLVDMLLQYGLPAKLSFEPNAILEILKMDKKRVADKIDFIVLEAIGKASICKISFDTIHEALVNFQYEGNR